MTTRLRPSCLARYRAWSARPTSSVSLLTGSSVDATPSEAVSWGKVDPDRLPDAVVCYTDTTIAMPLMTHYALARRKPRKLKRLYDQRTAMMKALTKEYFLHNKVKMIDGSEPMVD